MTHITFTPPDTKIEVSPDTKVLSAALRSKVFIIYGCGACRCGTCAVRISENSEGLKAMAEDEKNLLIERGFATDGSIRLACQARIREGEEVCVDLSFQSEM